MPGIQTPSRFNKPITPPSTSGSASTSGRVSRTLSPPYSSYSPTITGHGTPKMNVVTRVAIEGKAKHGHENGAAIKMYLKISIPLDVIPGSMIALFPEDNVKVLHSQVHPLDSSSAPYNFSSTTSPLLHSAARALNLPARSPHTFYIAHGLSPPHSPKPSSSASYRQSSSTHEDGLVDEKYAGQIVVSGYQISYILPRAFPSNYGDLDSQSRSSLGKRRSSLVEKNHMQFMAAIDIIVPYVSRPPRAPYLLSIPTPRCLHNNIKLRIFPPSAVSASNASLSSADEDGGSWDLASDPHVTRSPTRNISRAGSYTHFADDESSDSSTAGFSHDFGIQGTFPSTERIRVRWAKPMRTLDFSGGGGDGRRRVGVKESKGEMTCIVRGRMKHQNGADGVLMNVEYKGTCKGIWFAGVATLLGMDVGLEAKNSEVTWVSGFPSSWEVSGGTGYTGFDVGAQRVSGLSRHNSIDLSPRPPSRHDSTSSTSSTSSLLRAPLPNQNVPDYSFESSASSLSSSQATSGSSVPLSSSSNLTQAPGHAMTIHLNMNELSPPSHSFTFTISGTILVTPRSAISKANGATDHSDNIREMDPEPIVLPRFTVLAADSETATIMVKNDVADGNTNIEVLTTVGDVHRDRPARKSVLPRGGHAKCDPGARIALRSVLIPIGNGSFHPTTRSRTSSLNNSRAASPVPARKAIPSRPKRDGPLKIPSVTATITPLVSEVGLYPDAYAVRVAFLTPTTDSESIEFGLAKPGLMSSSIISLKDEIMNEGKPPRIDIIGASVQGAPVRVETTATVKQDQMSDVPFDEMSGKEWWTWIKVHTGNVIGEVIIDYVVRDDGRALKDKAKADNQIVLNVFLPTFSVAISRLEVLVEAFSDLEIVALKSNLSHQRPFPTGRQLLNYSMGELFYPYLSLTMQPARTTSHGVLNYLVYLILLSLLVGSGLMLTMNAEMKHLGRVLDGYSVMDPGWSDIAEPVTVTTTIYTGSGWWFGNSSKETERTPSAVSYVSATTTTPSSSTPLVTATTSPSPTHSESTATSLSPLTSLPSFSESVVSSLAVIPATIQNFPWEDLQPIRKVAAAALERLANAFQVVWLACRKAYHYPLQPP